MQIESHDIGERIERLRKKHGLSRETLAEELGITWQHLANIEKGRRKLTLDLLDHLRDIFNVTADYLMDGVEEENDLSDINALLAGVNPAVYPYVEESVIALVKAIHKDRELRAE